MTFDSMSHRAMPTIAFRGAADTAPPAGTGPDALLPDRPSIIPMLAMGGGLVGFVISLALPGNAAASNFPIDTWPTTLTIAVENGVFCAALAALFSVLAVAWRRGAGAASARRRHAASL